MTQIYFSTVQDYLSVWTGQIGIFHFYLVGLLRTNLWCCSILIGFGETGIRIIINSWEAKFLWLTQTYCTHTHSRPDGWHRQPHQGFQYHGERHASCCWEVMQLLESWGEHCVSVNVWASDQAEWLFPAAACVPAWCKIKMNTCVASFVYF